MYGDHAMLWPPGHSSSLKIIGQFSIVTFTPWASACSTISGHTRRTSSQLASMVFEASPPMKVLKYGMPIFAAASMTSFMWPIAAARTSASGCIGFG